MAVSTPAGQAAANATNNGISVQLGPVLSRAGEGTIYEIEDRPDAVAKIFHPELNRLAEKLDKVADMVYCQPSGATQEDGFTVLTWPTELVRQHDRPIGYVMPRIDTDTAVEIHALSNPASRANPVQNSPQWPARASWNHLLTVAANLCVAVDAVHAVDAVVGDFQERNILVADTCRVTLVDCDSMQFIGSAGKVYACAVGRPEFSAPEMLNQDLATYIRDKQSDLFALAIHIYLLLMAGNHPFLRGNWLGAGEQPGAMELAKTGDWAGGKHSRLETHALAPPITFLPKPIQELFARAFTHGAEDPQARPSATEWHAVLLETTVQQCQRGSHEIPCGTVVCPWCAIEYERARRRNELEARKGQLLKAPVLVVTPRTAGWNGSAAQSGRTGPLVTRRDAAHGIGVGPSKPKVKPPFRSTDYTKRRIEPDVTTSDDVGRRLYRLFLAFAIPIGLLIIAMIIWVAVVTVQNI